MAKGRQPGEITARFGLERCSACGDWLVKVKKQELTDTERAQLAKLGIATVATQYNNRLICSREQASIGICVEH